MKTILGLLLATLPALVACEKSEDIPQSGNKINVTKTTSEIIAKDNVFGLELFQKVLSGGKEEENVFVSPTSVALALAMTYNGADGETKTAMENTLKKAGFTMEEINISYNSLIDALLKVDPDVLLEIANSIWYREGFNVMPEFVSINQEYYDAKVSDLDFNLPSAPDVINSWVDDKTHGKITDIIDQIPAETMMYLINAIYFKGIWMFEFDEENTKDDVFILKDGATVMTPFMQQETTVKHGSNEIFSMVELPYGQGNYSMVIMLPHVNYTTDDIVSSLSIENWEQWINDLTSRNVRIRLPRFRFEYKNQLNDELEAMGMGIAFTNYADFSNINGTGNLFISKVIHKTFVEVNEEGTEAAAVTAVEISLTSVGPGQGITQFIADHPFVFAIRERDTGTLLFIGRMQNPLSESNE